MKHESIPLADLIKVEGGYAYKSEDFMAGDGYPVIKIKNIRFGNVDYSDTAFIEKELADKTKNWQTKEGDVLISMTGSGPNAPQSLVGRVARVWKGDPKSFINQRVGRIVPKDKGRVDLDFIFYFLSLPECQNYLVSNASGSANQANISGKLIESLMCPNISYEQSSAIARIGKVLDEKIFLNNRINETLEEIARSVFKSWFIDFDPVHAKTGGGKPVHMKSELATLFPNSFSEEGLPVGWEVKQLKDFDVEIESGKRPKGGIDKSLKAGIPSLGAESIFKVGKFDYFKVKFVESKFAEKIANGWVQNYDVAIYKDGANVGDPTRVSLFGDDFPFNRFLVNEHVFLIRSSAIGQPFLYYLFQSDSISHQLKSMGTSKAAQPGLNQQEVLSCQFVSPQSVLIDQFNTTVSPLIARQLAAGKENQTLKILRDTILPKLMSGEIRVKDAEKAVGEAL